MYQQVANEIKEEFGQGNDDLFLAVLFMKELYLIGFDYGMDYRGNWVYFNSLCCNIARDYFPGFTYDRYFMEIPTGE